MRRTEVNTSFPTHPPPPEPLPYTKLIAHARFPHPAPACSPTAAFPPPPRGLWRMRCGHALALRAGALGSRGLAPPPRRPPEQAHCSPFRVPCMRRERAPPPPARLLSEVTPSPQSVVPARVARSWRRGERGAVRPRRPVSFLHASVEAPPASAAIPVRVSERRGCGQSGADRLGPVPRAGAGPRKQEAAAARSGGDKGVVERGKERLGLARLGPAQRVGVLAAGGRMVQKEGQTALEEPQGSPNPAGVPGAPLEPPGAAAGPVPGGEETDTETETALGSRRFLCGVVEGKSSRRGRPTSVADRGRGGTGRCSGVAGGTMVDWGYLGAVRGVGIRGRPGGGGWNWVQLALLFPVSSPDPLRRPEEPALRGGWCAVLGRSSLR